MGRDASDRRAPRRHRVRSWVIEDREECCSCWARRRAGACGLLRYLFAGFSLRSGPDDAGRQQLAAVTRWRRAVNLIALQEMCTGMANNLLARSARTAPERAPFPQRPGYAPEITLALTPFDEATLHAFLHIERPEAWTSPTSPEGAPDGSCRGRPSADRRRPQEFDSLGGLYRGWSAASPTWSTSTARRRFRRARRTQSAASLSPSRRRSPSSCRSPTWPAPAGRWT